MKLSRDIIETEIAKNTTDKVYQRGVDYFEQGMVEFVVLRGHQLQAEVEGSEDEPYLVSLTLGANSIQDTACTCPYSEEWGGWCKHIVAALLFYLENTGDVAERPALQYLLAKMGEQQLRDLVQDLAANDPRLVSAVESWLTNHKSESSA